MMETKNPYSSITDHQDAPMNKLLVGPCDLLFTIPGVFIILQSDRNLIK